MKVKSIGFKNFRNLEEAMIPTDFKVVVMEGRNGSGKTSFLECIYSSLLLSTFRSSKLSDAICYDAPCCQMRCSVNKSGQSFDVLSYCDRKKKSIIVNDEKVSGYGRLFSLFSVAVLSYDDKKIVSSGPEERRKYMNQVACFADAPFSDVLRRYSSVLKERNKAIKERKLDVLDAIDDKIAELGCGVADERRKLVPQVEEYVNSAYENVFSQKGLFRMELSSNCSDALDKESYMSRLKASRNRDMILECTMIGPHRDDFVFYYDNRLVKDDFSTGQIRLLSIILKFAFIEIIRDRMGFSPVVLVDDVLLELDEGKKLLVFNHLLKYRQVFYTFLPQESFYKGCCDDMRIYKMTGGAIGGRDGARG